MAMRYTAISADSALRESRNAINSVFRLRMAYVIAKNSVVYDIEAMLSDSRQGDRSSKAHERITKKIANN